ncbi:MAG: plasmid recombination protein, partial [Oscillospiraceae bacterium]|nr:plasmid recombination protein [Oscillospiraceae bacterium]
MKTNRSVVRNQAYSKGGFSIRERHNERENVSYSNADIIRERAEYNVHYKKCDGSYEQEFNRMVDDGTISLRGLKSDAKVFDEFVFDVNSEYFEQNGGYEFAK